MFSWITSLQEWAQGKKTYITSIVLIVTATSAFLLGEIELQAYLVGLFAALQAMFLRAGVAKVG